MSERSAGRIEASKAALAESGERVTIEHLVNIRSKLGASNRAADVYRSQQHPVCQTQRCGALTLRLHEPRRDQHVHLLHAGLSDQGQPGDAGEEAEDVSAFPDT